jgi:GTPase
MDLPVVSIFTKVDLISDERKKELIQDFKLVITKLKLNRMPIVMKTTDDIVLFSRNIQEKTIMPMFFVSNMNWDGLSLMKSFLSMLPVNEMHQELQRIETEKTEVRIFRI